MFPSRSDRESKREQLERMISTETVTVTQPDIERLNQTVTCAEPSSPCREAAKGKSSTLYRVSQPRLLQRTSLCCAVFDTNIFT